MTMTPSSSTSSSPSKQKSHHHHPSPSKNLLHTVSNSRIYDTFIILSSLTYIFTGILYFFLLFRGTEPLRVHVGPQYETLAFCVAKTLPVLLLVPITWCIITRGKFRFFRKMMQKHPTADLKKILTQSSEGFYRFLLIPVLYSAALLTSAGGDFFLGINTHLTQVKQRDSLPDSLPSHAAPNLRDDGKAAETCMLLGILSFLVAQLLYSWAFSMSPVVQKNPTATKNSTTFKTILLLPFIGFTAFFFSFIMIFSNHSFSPSIRMAILFYALVIACMGWRSAVALVDSNHATKALFRFVGAIFFMFSDSMIGLSTFLPEMAQSLVPPPILYAFSGDYHKFFSLVIMITYWIAQVLITFSIEEPVLLHNEVSQVKLKALM